MTQPFAFLQPAPGRGDLARTRLLATAVELFGDHGPDGTTVRQIAEAAGQNVASIAYYFGGKEQLYYTVLEGIVGELQFRMKDVFEEIRNFREAGNPDAAGAESLLIRFFRSIYVRVLSRNEAAAIGRLVFREQLKPTGGFDVIYTKGFKQLHENLSYLVGVALGLDPRDRETIARTHLIMGQAYFMAVTREAILRRLGWKDLEGDKAEWVANLLEEHLTVLLAGLRKANTQATRRS